MTLCSVSFPQGGKYKIVLLIPNRGYICLLPPLSDSKIIAYFYGYTFLLILNTNTVPGFQENLAYLGYTTEQ